MHALRSTLRTLLASAAPCLLGVLTTLGNAGAQTTTFETQSEGPLIGIPQGLSTAPGTQASTGPLDASLLQVRGEGFDASAPSELPAPLGSAPDYRIDAILQGIPIRPDLDAFSTGLDWILTNGDGIALVPPGSWNAVSYSVTPGTSGLPGTAVRTEATRPDGAAGDLFAYVLPGSSLPPPLVGVPLRSQDSSEIALGSPAAPTPDLDAHDVFVDLVWGRNPQLIPLLPVALQTPRAFFSVSSATIGLVPPAWWGGSTPSGATVFCTEWDGSVWSEPRPLVTHADLGLTAAEDVDAIAVDFLREEMLFSTKTAGTAPVMWAGNVVKPTDGIGGIILRIYRLITGEWLPGGLDPLTVDDVDAICSLDPGSDPLLQQLIGSPDLAVLPLPNAELSVSVFRSRDAGSGLEFLHSYGSGWPAPGPGPGLIGCFLAIGRTNLWFDLPQAQPSPNRSLSSPFGGDPRSVPVALPQTASGLGVPVWFWWAAIDQSVQQLGTSWPVRIVL